MQDWPTPTISPYPGMTVAQAAWLIIRIVLFVGVCLFITISVTQAQEIPAPYVDEECQESATCSVASESTQIVWDLMFGGETLSKPYLDMTSSECEALRASLAIPTTCRPRLVEREKS
jgi:hypothetical protein